MNPHINKLKEWFSVFCAGRDIPKSAEETAYNHLEKLAKDYAREEVKASLEEIKRFAVDRNAYYRAGDRPSGVWSKIIDSKLSSLEGK